MLQQIVKKIPVQTAAAQVSTSLSQGGQRQVLVLDFMEEDQELLETLCTQSVGSTNTTSEHTVLPQQLE